MSIHFYGYKIEEDILDTYTLYSKDFNHKSVAYLSMFTWALENRYDLVIEAPKGYSSEAFKSETSSSLFFVPEYPHRFAQGDWKTFVLALPSFPALEEIVNKVTALEFLRSS